LGGAFNRFDDVNDGAAPRLLQILPRLDAGGAAREALDVARAVIAAGGAVVAASRDGAWVGEFRQAGGVHLPLPFEALSPLARLAIARRLRQAVDRHRIGLIHAYGRRGARLARRVAGAAGLPFVASPIGEAGRPPEQWVGPEMGAARAIVAPSPFVASLVPTAMEAAGAAVEIVPPGVDMARFDPARVRAEKLIRQSQAWRADDLPAVVLMPGRLSPGKGHDVLLRALARMDNRQAVCLMLTPEEGDGRWREKLLRDITALGLEGRARFVGYAPDMPVAYMIADVVVAPARAPAAFNAVCAEALAMGRPVVASATGGCRAIVVDGETGWLVPPEDADALARALDAALALGAEERASLAVRGRAHVAEHFALERSRERMLALYRKVIAARGPRTPA
jgi:glycosyltransferase involved in cell wall biosynthesis